MWGVIGAHWDFKLHSLLKIERGVTCVLQYKNIYAVLPQINHQLLVLTIVCRLLVHYDSKS